MLIQLECALKKIETLKQNTENQDWVAQTVLKYKCQLNLN